MSPSPTRTNSRPPPATPDGGERLAGAAHEAGVRVPGDVRVATWSNLGNGPVFAKELTRMEMDPEGDAEKIADALLAHLDGRPGGLPPTLAPKFQKGATL